MWGQRIAVIMFLGSLLLFAAPCSCVGKHVIRALQAKFIAFALSFLSDCMSTTPKCLQNESHVNSCVCGARKEKQRPGRFDVESLASFALGCCELPPSAFGCQSHFALKSCAASPWCPLHAASRRAVVPNVLPVSSDVKGFLWKWHSHALEQTQTLETLTLLFPFRSSIGPSCHV